MQKFVNSLSNFQNHCVTYVNLNSILLIINAISMYGLLIHHSGSFILHFSFFLSSFQFFKRTWMCTWVCGSLLSPLAQVRKYSYVLVL